MKLINALVSLGDGTLPESFKGLKSQVDIKWIESALAACGVATLRKRKLCAEQVVWLVVGMALYRDRPISEIVRRLDLVLPAANGKRQGISKAAIAPARERVGSEPLRGLFRTTARHWALQSAERYLWRGLKVLGADGTTLRVPDTAENREAFHLPPSSRRSAGYPQVRAVGLMVLRSHLLLDFAFQGCDVGEATVARPVLHGVPDDSLTILDRYFIDYYLWHQIRTGGQNRHWLVRARKRIKTKVVKRLGRGDELVEIEFPRALRSEHPNLPQKFQARSVGGRRKGFRPQVLLTSLLDAEKYPPAEIAQLYHERWELELGYDEIKTHTLESMEAIRSKSPERMAQEIWGLAVAYNLVRHEMEAVALDRGVSPQRISFRGSLRLMRDLFLWAEVASPGKLPKMIRDMRVEMGELVLPPRRSQRRYPRRVKIKMSGYARNDEHPA